jgi:hypothetical protein
LLVNILFDRFSCSCDKFEEEDVEWYSEEKTSNTHKVLWDE